MGKQAQNGRADVAEYSHPAVDLMPEQYDGRMGHKLNRKAALRVARVITKLDQKPPRTVHYAEALQYASAGNGDPVKGLVETSKEMEPEYRGGGKTPIAKRAEQILSVLRGKKRNPDAWMKMTDGLTKAQAETLSKKLKTQDRKLRALGSTGNYSKVEVRPTFDRLGRQEYGVFVVIREENGKRSNPGERIYGVGDSHGPSGPDGQAGLTQAEAVAIQKKKPWLYIFKKTSSGNWSFVTVKRLNPADTAAEMYEKFHGRESGEVIEVEDREHYHGHLSALGVLVEIKVKTKSGYRVEIGFASDVAAGAENPHKFDIDGISSWSPMSTPATATVDGHGVVSSLPGYDDRGNRLTGREADSDWGFGGKALVLSPAQQKRLHNYYTRLRRGVQFTVVGKQNPKGGVKGWLDRRGKAIAGVGDNYLKSFKKTFVNPKGPRYFLALNTKLQDKAPGADGIVKGSVVPVGRGTQLEVLKRSKDRALVHGNYIGTEVWGWVDKIHLLTHKQFVAHYDYDPTKKENPDHDTSGYTVLASNENGDQLYIEGGDQSLDLAAIHMDGKWVHDSIVIGDILEITYRTQKDFDKFETIDYFHKLGEVTGKMPQLRYDNLNQKLYIDGGQYFIKKPMIGTSPGLEN